MSYGAVSQAAGPASATGKTLICSPVQGLARALLARLNYQPPRVVGLPLVSERNDRGTSVFGGVDRTGSAAGSGARAVLPVLAALEEDTLASPVGSLGWGDDYR